MKKKLFFLPFVAALALAGCSQNEDIVGTDNPNGDATTSYLTVNLVSAPSMGTRATDPNQNNQYEDGIAAENSVTSVRFYFFDAAGNAAKVKKSGSTYESYLDWTVENDVNAGGNQPNVEKTLAATLIIESPSDGSKDNVPASVVAVINPTSEIKGETVNTLGELNGIIKDFSGTTTSFLMSNSVYLATNNKAEAVSVGDHIYPTPETAKNNPVVIYVERVLSKVRLGVNNISEAKVVGDITIYPTSTSEIEQEYDGKDIYVKFLGWNVTATADKSRLMKEINTNWASDLFGNDEPWNYAPYFRSFWAVNPTGLSYKYGSFNTESGEILPANALKDFTTGTNYTYVQENAAKDNTGADTETPTKVIIAAQLVDEDGNPMEFAEWTGKKFSVDGLKSEILKNVSLWKETKDGRVTIAVSDIEFKAAEDVEKAGKDTPGRYYVYAQLTDEATKEEWYADNNQESTSITTAAANAALMSFGHAKIWTSGYTYYYFDIEHLGSNGKGEYGVVRNHLYDAKITSIAGLGTPVYDPDKVIYPEKPGPDDQYIAAKINVLSWRLVPQNVELEW